MNNKHCFCNGYWNCLDVLSITLSAAKSGKRNSKLQFHGPWRWWYLFLKSKPLYFLPSWLEAKCGKIEKFLFLADANISFHTQNVVLSYFNTLVWLWYAVSRRIKCDIKCVFTITCMGMLKYFVLHYIHLSLSNFDKK